MQRDFLKHATAAMLLAATVAGAWAADEHPAVKRPIDLPPSADLSYDLTAKQRGFGLSGEALITWRAGDGKYSVLAESRVALLGKLTENRSQGAIDSFGLAPAEFYEKRFRKDPTTSAFNRDSKTLTFSEGKESYPLKGGEQDRASVTWQLAAVARAAGDKFRPGSTWPFFVAGRRDAQAWTFRVVKREKVHTGLGEVEAVQVTREPLPDAQGQSLDIWLAPSQEWYPVKLRFTDDDKDYVEQTLSRVTKK
ncbi:MAG: DUF3108 domain-containing protein [Massilia sp.]